MGKRDPTQLCIVETPADLLMVEHSQAYSGLYFVLMGRLSPLAGITRQSSAYLFRASWQNVERVVVRGEPPLHRAY